MLGHLLLRTPGTHHEERRRRIGGAGGGGLKNGGEGLDALPWTLLRWAIHILGMLLPILLVIYAFGASADAANRVQIIVSGCKTLMLMLVGTTALAVVYQLGVEVGSQVGRGNSTGLGQAVAARPEFGMGK